MKVELKPFQEIAATSLLDELAEAREACIKGKLQAVVLSAPTGSGKTITLASVIDQTFGGGSAAVSRPQTTFLWLSDSPELNVQSKAKLLGACDALPFHRMITVDSDSFDEEHLQPGYLYFINTQLLGRDKRLTQQGDQRQFTFWSTVANSITRAPQDLILVIDEAHKGAAANDRNRTTIMQKFILGSEADGMPPVPLVVGMSATPDRFNQLLGNTTRTQRPVIITAEDARSSGLLKDLIVVHNPRNKAIGDLTLLEEAAEQWQHFVSMWRDYCTATGERLVKPILVVQVQDGTATTLTRTNLADVVRVIERTGGALAVNEIVHCFQDQTDLEVAGRIIRHIDQSRIQDASDVKVVLFKTALSTGWDCPRAEIMMSFRRAQDATSIAQLVGRMIRTPLARRIATNEVLNTVDLFLPHYDEAALADVLERLRKPDGDDGIPTRVETATIEYRRAAALNHVFDRLKAIPTYSVQRVPKMGDVKRALRLVGMLLHEGIDGAADERLRRRFTDTLRALRDRYAREDATWESLVKEGGEIDVDVTTVAVGLMTVTGRRTTRLTLSPENIEQLFDQTGRCLAAGEGLHRTYWKRFHDREAPNTAKLELFAVAKNPTTIAELEKLARAEFTQLWEQHAATIQSLPPGTKARFHTLKQATGKPVQIDWELPEAIVDKRGGAKWAKHLYVDKDGEFRAELNGWEKAVLEVELQRRDVVGWLRNQPRKEWAMCIPYEFAGVKPFYPDFVIVRQAGGGLVIDILEPHDDTRTDTWAKIRGLAAFADEHGLEFGRLIVARKRAAGLQVVDVNKTATRERARRMQSPNDLESLFSVCEEHD